MDAIQQALAPWYYVILFLHLLFLGVWAFSATGAFWLVAVAGRERRANPQDSEAQRRDDWARWHFNVIVRAEHIAFPLLLLTGLLLYVTAQWQASANPWLWWKLLIVLGVFLPMELYDTWLSHHHVPRAMRNKAQDLAAFKRAIRRQDRFIRGSLWIVLLLIPLVMFLAVVKPAAPVF